MNDTDNARRLLARLPFARPRGPRPALVLVHHLPLPLSSSVPAGELVGTHIPSVDRDRHGPLPKRGPERTGTPWEAPTYRYLTSAPHRRSTPSRSPALVASQPPEEVTVATMT